MSKILLLSQHLDNYAEVAAITHPTREAYCAHWRSVGKDYTFRVQLGDYKPELKLPFGFQRIRLIRDILDEPAAPDVVVWQGADTIILNPNWSIEDFIDGRHECWYDWYVAYDVHGLNTDSFIIRNTGWARQWLDFILSQAHASDGWAEQRICQRHWQEEQWLHRICVLPQGLINAYLYELYPPWNIDTAGRFQHGDWLLHLVGLNREQRLAILRSEWIKTLVVPWGRDNTR